MEPSGIGFDERPVNGLFGGASGVVVHLAVKPAVASSVARQATDFTLSVLGEQVLKGHNKRYLAIVGYVGGAVDGFGLLSNDRLVPLLIEAIKELDGK